MNTAPWREVKGVLPKRVFRLCLRCRDAAVSIFFRVVVNHPATRRERLDDAECTINRCGP